MQGLLAFYSFVQQGFCAKAVQQVFAHPLAAATSLHI